MIDAQPTIQVYRARTIGGHRCILFTSAHRDAVEWFTERGSDGPDAYGNTGIAVTCAPCALDDTRWQHGENYPLIGGESCAAVLAMVLQVRGGFALDVRTPTVTLTPGAKVWTYTPHGKVTTRFQPAPAC